MLITKRCSLCGADFSRDRSLKMDIYVPGPDSIREVILGHRHIDGTFFEDVSFDRSGSTHSSLRCSECDISIKYGSVIRKYAFLPESELPLHVNDPDLMIREISKYRMGHSGEGIGDLVSFARMILENVTEQVIGKKIII